METLESSRMCRLCGQQSGICINIFDKSENHVKKINTVLPILVHEMDSLPKQMCHRCSYKLEEFHKFYSDCLKTDMDLKSQLSWMRKENVKEHISVPMVQIENVRIKSEPPDYDIYELDPIVENVNYINSMTSVTYPMKSTVNNNDISSHRINDVNKCLRCNERYNDCLHYKHNYDEKQSTNKALLSINCTNIKDKHDARRDFTVTNLGRSSTLNKTIRNSPRKGSSKDETHKAENRLSRDSHGVDTGNKLKTNKVKEITIKTEKPDDIEIRSLRPRNKTIDYYSTKILNSDLIVNPANILKKVDSKKKTIIKQTANFTVNGIVVDKIKKEPIEEEQSRNLRPRRFLINYLGLKRKNSGRTDSQTISGNEKVSTKKHKSSLGCGKRFTGLIFNPCKVKVKEEIISDEEASSVQLDGETRCNVTSGSCVPNFSRETELQENIKDEFSHLNWTSAAGSRVSSRTKTSTKMISKAKLRKTNTGKQILDKNLPQKYLRSQGLRLRNGKVTKYEHNQDLSLSSLKKRFLQLATTRQSMIGRKLPSKIKENVNVIKVPTKLKTSSNIKQFCEKCCTTFMNKELYMLHACYND